MKTFPAKCKFCGCSLNVEMDEDAFTMFKVDYWLGLAACNWCADYRAKLLSFIDVIYFLSMSHRQCQFMSAKAGKEAMPRLREKVEIATKGLCRLVDKHWKTTTPWTNEFVDILLDKPAHTRSIVLDYSRHTEQEAKKAHAARAVSQPYAD